MDESVTDEVRRQSILKCRPRFPLQEVQSLFGDDDTVTTTITRNRRVSFGRKIIKEFLVGSAVSTQAVHEYEQSSESVSDPSDCSGPLDLALNKSCRDLEAEFDPAEQVFTPPESFSDSKSKAPEQRARIFTENCINIAKSVFKDTETELTAIIIGAKPTTSDEDHKNSSCMSFTTLEVSQDYGHKKHHDFVPMRHSELLSHHDQVHQNGKGRYDFLDHSIGNAPLGAAAKPNRQLPRTPLARISHVAPWDAENDENIPPAHSSFRLAHTPAFRPNTSEMTMEFTCANVAQSRMQSFSSVPESGVSQMDADMEETCANPLAEKSLNLTRANNLWETSACDASDKEDPLRLDAPHDDFLQDLLETEGKDSSDDSDSSPFKNIHRELANLSNTNQSFREKVLTLPGILNATAVHLDMTGHENPLAENLEDDSNLSFLQTPKADKQKQTALQEDGAHIGVHEETMFLEMENTGANTGEPDPLGDWPTPRKGNISIFDASDDESDQDKNDQQDGADMEFTHCNVNVQRDTIRDDVVEKAAIEVSMDDENTMEFTRNVFQAETANETVGASENKKITELNHSSSVVSHPDNTKCANSTMQLEDVDKLGEIEKQDPVEKTEIAELTMELTKLVEPTVCNENNSTDGKISKLDLLAEVTMELENDHSMQLTNVILPNPEMIAELKDIESDKTLEVTSKVDIIENLGDDYPGLESQIENNTKKCDSTEIMEITMQGEIENNEDTNDTLPVEKDDLSSSLADAQQEVVARDETENLPVPSPFTDVNDDDAAPGYENVTQMNATASVEPPLETPVTGLAALSTRPSLKDQLQSAPPDSTTSSVCYEQSELVEEALRSMEMTEGSIGGVLPKPMKTMSEEQHMKAIHESTRVMEEPSVAKITNSEETYLLKLPKDNTYTLVNAQEATFTIRDKLNVSDGAAKRTHTESPCPGEKLKKVRASQSPLVVVDNTFGKRVHTDSPLPDQSLLKKSRASNTPRVVRSLGLTINEPDESILVLRGNSSGLDVSLTLNDITLSETERRALSHSCSFGLLPMSLPERSVVADELGLTDITIPQVMACTDQDTITSHMPLVAMSNLSVEESQLEVSSTTNLEEPDSDVESNPLTPSQVFRMETCSLQDTTTSGSSSNERIIKKTQTALEQQSNENSCVWKLLKFDVADGLIQIDLPLLATGLILDIAFSDVAITNLRMTHRAATSYQRSIKNQINGFGFETLGRYISKEENKIRNLADIPHYLDFFNSFTLKLNSLMIDTLTVLHGCAGSRLCGHHLSIPVNSFPGLISCWVDLNLNDLLLLGQPVLQFRHETGRLNEQAVRALFTDVKQPVQQNFVRSLVSYVETEEEKSGFVTKRPPLLF